MKILFFADLHARKVYRSISSGFLDDVLLTISEIKEIADQEGVETIICLGDLFHRINNISIELLTKIYSAFRDLRTFKLIFLTGNHDISQGCSILEIFKSLGSVYERPGMFKIEDKTFFCFPYTTGEYFWEEADVFLGHLSIAEGQLDSTDIKLKDELSIDQICSFFTLGLMGHYHKRQRIKNFHYVGSALQLSFGEAGQKKFCAILDTKDLSLKWRELTKARKYLVISLPSEKIPDWSILEKYIVKFVLEREEAQDLLVDIPEKIFYFVEMAYSAKSLVSRIASNTFDDAELVRKFVDVAETDLDKEHLIEMGDYIIQTSQ